MAHGGIVKKFREGGSSLRDYYNEDLATYQEIMAPTDADRRTAKQSMLMDISSRALANAGGAGADKNISSQRKKLKPQVTARTIFKLHNKKFLR